MQHSFGVQIDIRIIRSGSLLHPFTVKSPAIDHLEVKQQGGRSKNEHRSGHSVNLSGGAGFNVFKSFRSHQNLELFGYAPESRVKIIKIPGTRDSMVGWSMLVRP